jgi:hypothetical protein
VKNDSLLSLFTRWQRGATILAGTGVLPADPVSRGPRVICECSDCPTWCLGADQVEALDRLADHRRRCHVALLTMHCTAPSHG